MNKLFKQQKMEEVVLSVIFLIFIFSDFKPPELVSSVIDTFFGKLIVILFTISLFFYVNPILSVLGVFVAFFLIKRSSIVNGSFGLQYYMPSEEKKTSQFTAFNQFPYTLEQEIVKKMAPIHKIEFMESKPTFKPLLDNLHDASMLS